MENNQNQGEFTFDELISMADFNLEEEAPKEPSEVVIEIKEEVKEETNEEPKEEIKPESPVIKETENSFSKTIKEKLESGEWDDVLIETEDGSEKKLSELEDVSQETFKSIESAIKEDKDREFKAKYIDVEGLDEISKKLINIIKSGDLEEAKKLFENPEALKEPFKGYDSDNDTHNEQVLKWYYSEMGHTTKEINSLVRTAKEELTLDDKAQKIVDFQRKAFSDKLENTEKALTEEKNREIEEIKEYKKNLSSSLKEEGLSENLVRKFVDVATKKDSTGNFEIDAIYEDIMKDPKRAKELIYFMLDKDDYLKKATLGAKKNVQMDNLKKIRIIQDTTKTNKKKPEEEAKTGSILETITFD